MNNHTGNPISPFQASFASSRGIPLVLPSSRTRWIHCRNLLRLNIKWKLATSFDLILPMSGRVHRRAPFTLCELKSASATASQTPHAVQREARSRDARFDCRQGCAVTLLLCGQRTPSPRENSRETDSGKAGMKTPHETVFSTGHSPCEANLKNKITFLLTGLDSLNKARRSWPVVAGMTEFKRECGHEFRVAGWSSLAARLPHKQKVAGSNPASATKIIARSGRTEISAFFLGSAATTERACSFCRWLRESEGNSPDSGSRQELSHPQRERACQLTNSNHCDDQRLNKIFLPPRSDGRRSLRCRYARTVVDPSVLYGPSNGVRKLKRPPLWMRVNHPQAGQSNEAIRQAYSPRQLRRSNATPETTRIKSDMTAPTKLASLATSMITKNKHADSKQALAVFYHKPHHTGSATHHNIASVVHTSAPRSTAQHLICGAKVRQPFFTRDHISTCFSKIQKVEKREIPLRQRVLGEPRTTPGRVVILIV